MATKKGAPATAAKASAKSGAKVGEAKNVQPAAGQLGAPGASNELGTTGPSESDGRGSSPRATSTPGLEVTSSQDGFWRADLMWSSTPTTVKLCELTQFQIDQLRGEPVLSVVDVDVQFDDEGA